MKEGITLLRPKHRHRCGRRRLNKLFDEARSAMLQVKNERGEFIETRAGVT